MSKGKKSRNKPSRISIILPYIGILAVAAALIAAVIVVTSRHEGDDRQIQTIGANTEAETENDQSPKPDGLVEEGQTSPIAKLVGEYFEAIKTADVDALERIIRPSDAHETEDVLQKKAQRSEGYLNIQCYTLPGPVDNSWIVYVYYEEKYININTPAPNMNRFYVCMDENGSYYIDKNTRTPEYNAWLDEISRREDVNNLLNEVNVRMEEAVSSDENLKKLMNMIAGGNGGTDAQTEEASEESAEEESAETAE